MNEFDIVIYAYANGKEPFSKWLKSIKDKKTQRIILLRIQRLRCGNFGDSKSIKGAKKLHELRIDYGPGYRIYFAKVGTTVILLLGGGDKNSQIKDIEQAKLCLSKYEGNT